jgi:hypothetical protein
VTNLSDRTSPSESTQYQYTVVNTESYGRVPEFQGSRELAVFEPSKRPFESIMLRCKIFLAGLTAFG